jgi:hypothetical protein
MMYLAETAAAASDTMVSGNFITALVVALIGAAATAYARISGKKQGLEEATNNVTIQSPVPTVRTKEEPEYVTMASFNGHLKRIEESIAGIESALENERGIARTANGNIHHRIDALSERLGERLSKLEGTLSGVAETTRTLLEIALNKKP